MLRNAEGARRRLPRATCFAKDLMEMGTATRGVITYLHVQTRGDREPSTVQFQFTAPDNLEQVTTATLKDFPIVFPERMPVGAEITVLYDPSNLERSIPYPLCPFKVVGQS